MKKRKDYLLATILTAVNLCFLCACSADEQVLFVESTDASTDETGAQITGAEGVAQNDVTQETAWADSGNASVTTVVFEENRLLAIHVCGAVKVPGVYELTEGSRIMDAVLLAGGFSEEADEEYVNLATVLKDGDKVRIPTKTEVAEMSVDGALAYDNGVTNAEDLTDTGESTQDKVNINTADAEELCTLPGIGQTRAESILAYRKEHGEFSEIEDIMQVSGIKESSFQKIKDKITVK